MKHITMRVLSALWLSCFLLPGCGPDEGTNPPPEPTGHIEVTLGVEGSPPDPDGVGVVLDGQAGVVLEDGESYVFADLTLGSHSVHIDNVAWHCDLAGDPERSVEVRANETSQVPVNVNCRNIGALVVATRTAGSAVDPDGYTVQVEGRGVLPASDGAAATWPELGPGQYQMSLLGLADHCWIPGESTMSVEVAAAESTYVSFGIACPPFHDHIAYGSDRDGELDLWVMRSDGSSPINLTPGALGGNDPSWSADATRMAFAGGPPDGIWVMEMDGSAPQWIGEGYSPQWSPDGQQILLVGGGTGTYVMDADGSNVTPVIEAYCESPQWSPDGLQVAFVSGQDCGEGDPGYLKSIYVANLDGTGKRRVTSGATALKYDMEPAWHPGTRIAFAGFGDGLGTSDIYTIEPDGSGLRRLTDTGHGHAWEPQWSPDGEWLVFSHDPHPEGRQICVVRGDGTGYRCLTSGYYFHIYPSWSAGP